MGVIDKREPGDLGFGKQFLSKDPVAADRMRLKELKNGRLAMLAIMGVAFNLPSRVLPRLHLQLNRRHGTSLHGTSSEVVLFSAHMLSRAHRSCLASCRGAKNAIL